MEGFVTAKEAAEKWGLTENCASSVRRRKNRRGYEDG